MTRKLGYFLIVLMAASPVFAARVGVISGYIRDGSGSPQMGAVVDIYTTATTVGYTAYTDAQGFYSANNLPPGKYQVKVTAGSFLPSLRENVKLNSGAHVLVNLTLNTLADALKLLPPAGQKTLNPMTGTGPCVQLLTGLCFALWKRTKRRQRRSGGCFPGARNRAECMIA